MAFEFVETLTLTMPDIEGQLAAFTEAEYNKNHGLIIEVAAIHEGMTANFNYYPAASLEDALESWISPYPKPIIMNHDAYSEPVGRVMGAKMDKETDGTPYVRLQVAVTDPEAIAKVSDQRYLTGSVGGKAEEAVCNICGADWANASMFSAPCKHVRGTPYKGKVAHIEMRKIGFKEYSFVNMPADQRSNVRAIGTATATGESEQEDDGWIRTPRFFSLDMASEAIVEFSESESRNLLSGKRKKDSSPIYHQLRGAFLLARAVDDKEFDVNEDEIVEEEEDILAVTEDLSLDLSAPVESLEEDSEEEAVEETAETEETQEESSPEGQERPNKGEDPESPDSVPKNREAEEDAEVVAESKEEDNEAEELTEDNESVELLAEANQKLADLEARYQALLGENVKLKTSLKRVLAERVVDTKIAVGLNKAEDREELLSEHVNRSATSLADSIRDLASMPFKVPAISAAPTVEDLSGSVDEDNERILTVGEEVKSPTGVNPEEFFVDVLMNRRKI